MLLMAKTRARASGSQMQPTGMNIRHGVYLHQAHCAFADRRGNNDFDFLSQGAILSKFGASSISGAIQS